MLRYLCDSNYSSMIYCRGDSAWYVNVRRKSTYNWKGDGGGGREAGKGLCGCWWIFFIWKGRHDKSHFTKLCKIRTVLRYTFVSGKHNTVLFIPNTPPPPTHGTLGPQLIRGGGVYIVVDFRIPDLHVKCCISIFWGNFLEFSRKICPC